jgi:hypothetical protein
MERRCYESNIQSTEHSLSVFEIIWTHGRELLEFTTLAVGHLES